jgi:hypothetical protein
MTDLSENETPEVPENAAVLFAIQTPLGTMMVDADALPPELRAEIVGTLRAKGLPADVRARLAASLGVDMNDLAPTAESRVHAAERLADTAGAPEGADVSAVADAGSQAPTCARVEIHREEVWNMLDVAFSDNPHHWQAAAALFKLSVVSPTQISSESRLAALEEAALHIQRSIDLLGQPLSPLEQQVAEFRKQMGL